MRRILFLGLVAWGARTAGAPLSLVSQERSAYAQASAAGEGWEDRRVASGFGPFSDSLRVEARYSYHISWALSEARQVSNILGDSIHAEGSARGDRITYDDPGAGEARSDFEIRFQVATPCGYRAHAHLEGSASSSLGAIGSGEVVSQVTLTGPGGVQFADSVRCVSPEYTCEGPHDLARAATLLPGDYTLSCRARVVLQTPQGSFANADATWVLDLVLSDPMVAVQHRSWSSVKRLYR